MENEAIPRTKSASAVREAETNMDDGCKIVSVLIAEDAEEHVREVSDKAEMSCEKSNAASLAKEATEINSATDEQDKPVEESSQEILMGSLDVKVRSTTSDAITSNVDPQRRPDSALEADDIKRVEFINEEVWQ